MALQVEKKLVKIGGMSLGVSMDAKRADRIRKSVPYRYLLKPAANLIGGRKNGHKNGNGRTGSAAYDWRPKSLPSPVAPGTPITKEAQEIIDKISTVEWYHSIDLPHGVTTPGFVDHRPQLHMYQFPEDMTGWRVLDVATYDGFWAFEFERRGAEVIGIDLETTADVDIPRNWREDALREGLEPQIKGNGFRMAKEILGAKAQREVCSVYELSPEKFGMFDFVYISDVLLHLERPLTALENIWRVTKHMAMVADVYNPDLEEYGDRAFTELCMDGMSDVWWRPNSRTLEMMLRIARFSRIEQVTKFDLNTHFEGRIPKVVFKAYK
jgi:tRNA (mo5U34)-methyltransferase